MKLLFLVASAHAFGAFGEMAELAEDWDCSKYDEKDKEGYMKAGIHKPWIFGHFVDVRGQKSR